MGQAQVCFLREQRRLLQAEGACQRVECRGHYWESSQGGARLYREGSAVTGGQESARELGKGP